MYLFLLGWYVCVDERTKGGYRTSLGSAEPTEKVSRNMGYRLGPAKTYVLRGTPPTYAIKTRAATNNYQERPRQTKPKKGQFMNFSQGHSGTKVRYVNRVCFPFFGLVCRGNSWN